eukprot:8534895-Pyramimonas_sp.AAC.1
MTGYDRDMFIYHACKAYKYVPFSCDPRARSVDCVIQFFANVMVIDCVFVGVFEISMAFARLERIS